MAKVTSKLQVTVPKAIADMYRIRPGDEIEWVAAGDVIRVVPGRQPTAFDNREVRLRLFDRATERQQRSKTGALAAPKPPKDRGWTREDLYRRGRTG